MSSGPGSFAKALNLGELAFPYVGPSGVVTSAQRKAQAVANLGITATAAELNYLDITTLGTGEASKAVVLDAGEDYVWPATGILTYGVLKDPAGTTLTATVDQINKAALPLTYAAVTATADGLTTGLIANGVRRTTITSAAATNAVTLPGIAANSLPIGYTIIGRVTANGCEMLTPSTTNETINGVDSDGTNQLDVAANSGFLATVVSTTGWDVLPFGTVVAPDND